MNKLNEAAAAARRAAAWLLPAGRRDWVAAIWAEAHEVPPGLERLAWRAGGVWVIAREALMPRRIARAALFAVAAGAAAWAAWPQPAVGHATVSQFHVIATVLLLAGLPLLARRFLRAAQPQPGRPVAARLLLRSHPGPLAGPDHRRGVCQPDAGAACVPVHLLRRPGLE
jgi:hypothetical protein